MPIQTAHFSRIGLNIISSADFDQDSFMDRKEESPWAQDAASVGNIASFVVAGKENPFLLIEHWLLKLQARSDTHLSCSHFISRTDCITKLGQGKKSFSF